MPERPAPARRLDGVASVDMGCDNTGRFPCAYCYANMSLKLIDRNLREHHPAVPALIYNSSGPVMIIREKHPGVAAVMQSLFE